MSEMQDRLSQVRFYTDQDPYFYTVDNRPLGDLDANDKALATGIDAAKYTANASALALSFLTSSIYGSTDLFVTQGLSFSDLNITLGSGLVLKTEPISLQNSKLVVKQGLLVDPVTLTLSKPVSAGNAVDYLIEVAYTPLSPSTPTLPLVDSDNPYLVDLIVGTCSVQILKGNESTAGTQIPPSNTPGYLPAFKVTVKSDVSSIGLGDVYTYPQARIANMTGVISPELKNYTETTVTTTVTASATTIDLKDGNVVDITLASDTDLSFAGAPINGKSANLTIFVRQDSTGGKVLRWPTTLRWAGGSPPVLSTGANSVDVISLTTHDSGTNWYAFPSGLGMS